MLVKIKHFEVYRKEKVDQKKKLMHLLNVSNGTPLINTRLNTTNGYLAQ